MRGIRWGMRSRGNVKGQISEPKASGPAASPGTAFSTQTPSPLWMINEWPLNMAQRLCTRQPDPRFCSVSIGLPGELVLNN